MESNKQQLDTGFYTQFDKDMESNYMHSIILLGNLNRSVMKQNFTNEQFHEAYIMFVEIVIGKRSL